MKIWEKGANEIDKLFEAFTIGQDAQLDLHLAKYDAWASQAHVSMLEKVGLLSKAERDQLIEGLKNIAAQIEKGDFQIEEGIEDCHSQIELQLIRTLGGTGKTVHSGRSRNGPVLVALKLYTRAELITIAEKTYRLFQLLQQKSEANKEILMPGYTHMQVAMPSSFGLWFGAFAESLTDDLVMLKAAHEIADKNPLGSAAGYGSSFPLDREITTRALGFADLNHNSIYAQMTRGKLEKITAQALSSLAGTLNKLASDVCTYSGQDFGFFRHAEKYTTGSSIMPHKQNPDGFELLRARTNQLQALPFELSMILTNLPTGYHRDLQLLKEKYIPAIISMKSCLDIATAMISAMEIHPDIITSEKYDLLFTVEAVNEEVRKGTPFRDAYKKIGQQVQNGTYVPDRNPKHSHIGSIGNLSNENIRQAFAKVYDYFVQKKSTT